MSSSDPGSSPSTHPTVALPRCSAVVGGFVLPVALMVCCLGYILGCGGAEHGNAAGEAASPDAPATTDPAATPGAPHDPAGGGPETTVEMLPRPFSAEAIRQAWGEGLVVVLRNVTPEGVQLQRWTVVSADPEWVEIEFAMTDEAGVVQGEPTVQRSTWDDLAAHGDFPAATTRREKAVRATPLGELEGWLYTQDDATAESVSESFFAHDHAGAPVLMKVTQSGVVTLEMAMIGWSRP